MQFFNNLWKSLLFWNNINIRYQNIKNNEEERPKSIKMGVHSIVNSIIGVIIACLGIWLLIVCIQNLQALNVEASPDWAGDLILAGMDATFYIIGIVLGAGVVIAALFGGMVRALIYLIYQLKLNKRAIGWVALGILIAGVIGIILTVVFMLI